MIFREGEQRATRGYGEVKALFRPSLVGKGEWWARGGGGGGPGGGSLHNPAQVVQTPTIQPPLAGLGCIGSCFSNPIYKPDNNTKQYKDVHLECRVVGLSTRQAESGEWTEVLAEV